MLIPYQNLIISAYTYQNLTGNRKDGRGVRPFYSIEEHGVIDVFAAGQIMKPPELPAQIGQLRQERL